MIDKLTENLISQYARLTNRPLTSITPDEYMKFRTQAIDEYNKGLGAIETVSSNVNINTDSGSTISYMADAKKTETEDTVRAESAAKEITTGNDGTNKNIATFKPSKVKEEDKNERFDEEEDYMLKYLQIIKG